MKKKKKNQVYQLRIKRIVSEVEQGNDEPESPLPQIFRKKQVHHAALKDEPIFSTSGSFLT